MQIVVGGSFATVDSGGEFVHGARLDTKGGTQPKAAEGLTELWAAKNAKVWEAAATQAENVEDV